MAATSEVREARSLRDAVASLLHDPRDMPFLVLAATATVVVIPFAIALYIPGVFRWWLAVAYLLVNGLVFLDRFILMLHNTSHRTLFKPRYRLLNLYIPWVLGPFFGETPETFYSHHVGMHHFESNLPEDLSTTMPYERDRFTHFLHYYGVFMSRGIVDLGRYLTRKGRVKIRERMFLGELSFMLVAGLLLFVNWKATLVVFVGPMIAVRFLMLAGNWGQHAFVDAETPESSYRNSITSLGARYNRRCFNDGYHIGHHVKATRHWTEMPADFEANRKKYALERAIVFDEGIDHFMVWLLLMTKQYKVLARHYVTLDGERPSDEEIIALLRLRTRPIQLPAGWSPRRAARSAAA
jgi:hypothetical protein